MKADNLLDMIGDIDDDIIAEADINNKKKIINPDVIRIKWFRKPSVLVAVVALMVLGAVTTLAAINGFWSRSIEGILPSDDEQRQTIEDKGYVAVLNQNVDQEDLSVTFEGITIAPIDVICDGENAYVAFSVEGYDASQAAYMSIASNASVGDDTFDASYGIGAQFYPGYTSNIDEDGYDRTEVYDNGEPLEWMDEEHLFIVPKYTDENGRMECIVNINSDKSLLGQVLHVEINSIVEFSNDGDEKATEGNWNFDITLPGCENRKELQLGTKIEGSDFVLEKVSMSPLSIDAYFTWRGVGEKTPMDVPVVIEVILKNGD